MTKSLANESKLTESLNPYYISLSSKDSVILVPWDSVIGIRLVRIRLLCHLMSKGHDDWILSNSIPIYWILTTKSQNFYYIYLFILSKDLVIIIPGWDSVTWGSVIGIQSVGTWLLRIQSLCHLKSKWQGVWILSNWIQFIRIPIAESLNPYYIHFLLLVRIQSFLYLGTQSFGLGL
jgi:hypothetical protein